MFGSINAIPLASSTSSNSAAKRAAPLQHSLTITTPPEPSAPSSSLHLVYPNEKTRLWDVRNSIVAAPSPASTASPPSILAKTKLPTSTSSVPSATALLTSDAQGAAKGLSICTNFADMPDFLSSATSNSSGSTASLLSTDQFLLTNLFNDSSLSSAGYLSSTSSSSATATITTATATSIGNNDELFEIFFGKLPLGVDASSVGTSSTNSTNGSILNFDVNSLQHPLQPSQALHETLSTVPSGLDSKLDFDSLFGNIQRAANLNVPPLSFTQPTDYFGHPNGNIDSPLLCDDSTYRTEALRDRYLDALHINTNPPAYISSPTTKIAAAVAAVAATTTAATTATTTAAAAVSCTAATTALAEAGMLFAPVVDNYFDELSLPSFIQPLESILQPIAASTATASTITAAPHSAAALDEISDIFGIAGTKRSVFGGLYSTDDELSFLNDSNDSHTRYLQDFMFSGNSDLVGGGNGTKIRKSCTSLSPLFGVDRDAVVDDAAVQMEKSTMAKSTRGAIRRRNTTNSGTTAASQASTGGKVVGRAGRRTLRWESTASSANDPLAPSAGRKELRRRATTVAKTADTKDTADTAAEHAKQNEPASASLKPVVGVPVIGGVAEYGSRIQRTQETGEHKGSYVTEEMKQHLRNLTNVTPDLTVDYSLRYTFAPRPRGRASTMATAVAAAAAAAAAASASAAAATSVPAITTTAATTVTTTTCTSTEQPMSKSFTESSSIPAVPVTLPSQVDSAIGTCGINANVEEASSALNVSPLSLCTSNRQPPQLGVSWSMASMANIDTDPLLQLSSVQPLSKHTEASVAAAAIAAVNNIMEESISAHSAAPTPPLPLAPSSVSDPSLAPLEPQPFDPNALIIGNQRRCPHPGCDRMFARLYNLKSHLRSHAPIRPYGCPGCSKTFSRKHDLQRHARVHTGDKPYRCEGGCGKQFARTDALRRHLKVEGKCRMMIEGAQGGSGQLALFMNGKADRLAVIGGDTDSGIADTAHRKKSKKRGRKRANDSDDSDDDDYME